MDPTHMNFGKPAQKPWRDLTQTSQQETPENFSMVSRKGEPLLIVSLRSPRTEEGFPGK